MRLPDKKPANLADVLIDIHRLSEQISISSSGHFSEKLCKNLIESAPDGIIILTPDGFIKFCNKTFTEIIGLPKEKIEGKQFSQLPISNNDNAEKTLVDFKSVIKGEITGPYEFSWIHQDGSIHSAEIRFSLIKDKDDEKTWGIQAIARDITRHKIKYEQLKIANEYFYQTQKLESIGMLAGGIAHDFNNLLAVILGNISLARMLINSEDKVFNILGRAEKVSLQARDLILQLMSFAKSGAPVKKPVSVSKIIRDATDLALSGSKIRCEFLMSDYLLPIEVDEGQLIQAIGNIIINAEKSIHEGGIIRLSAETITIKENVSFPLEKGVYVKITLKYHGVNMPKEKIDQLSETFFTNKPNSLELGLKIAYSIIKEYGGNFFIDSQAEAGTTCDIYLPAYLKEVAATCEAMGGSANQLISQGKGKILVMDDEVEVREIVGAILTHYGYTVEYVSNGMELINFYRKAKDSGDCFAVVIMDLTIKGGLGAEVAIKELLEIDPKAKAIVSSGYTNDRLMTDFKKYGFRGVIAKPYQVEELMKTLNQVLNSI